MGLFLYKKAFLRFLQMYRSRLKWDFRNARTISRHSPIAWLFWPSNLNPRNFWLWELSENCCFQSSDCKIWWIETTHCITHSERDSRGTSISCGSCCFLIPTYCREWWTVYCFASVLQTLKIDFIDTFYAVFVLRIIKNHISPIRCDMTLPWWMGLCNSQHHTCTLNSAVCLTCKLNLNRFFTIHLSFVVELF